MLRRLPNKESGNGVARSGKTLAGSAGGSWAVLRAAVLGSQSAVPADEASAAVAIERPLPGLGLLCWLSGQSRRWGLSPSRRQIELLLDDADPPMVLPVWRSGKCNVCYEFHAALLESFGQLSECLCLDSHCCYLVRFTAFIIPDRAGN